MSLTPRLVAIQGIGFSAIELAVQGLLESIDTTPVVIFRAGVSARRGGGPDANLSLSDYLKKFGRSTDAPVASASRSPVQTSAQLAIQARKRRQRREEEIFALADF